jgi:hypothetical protein
MLPNMVATDHTWMAKLKLIKIEKSLLLAKFEVFDSYMQQGTVLYWVVHTWKFLLLQNVPLVSTI